MVSIHRPDTISLNAQRYRIAGPIVADLVPQEQQTPRHQHWYMNDWRGGLGVEIRDDELGRNRFWWSGCNTLFKGHLILPRLAAVTSSDPGTVPRSISHLGGTIYARWGTEIYAYNNGSDTWGAALHTGLPSTLGDFINITLDDGTNLDTYLVIAYETGYDYSVDGSTWTSSTEDAKYLTSWDHQMWGISTAGQLWSAFTPGDEFIRACMPIEGNANGELVTDILTGPDASGDIIIYVCTNRGLWAYDVDNDRFVATALNVPAGITNGAGSVYWRNSIYYPAGSEIYEYTPGEVATLREMGPGNDSHGLPDDQKGRIIKLVATHNELLALLDTTALSGNTGSAFSILAYNDRHNAWRVLHEHGTANIQSHDMFAANSYGAYRLWYGFSSDIAYINLPYEAINDMMTTDADYAASAEHITSWMEVPDDHDFLAVRLRVNVRNSSANETVKVDYGTNLSTSWTNLGTISSDGVTTYEFPNSSTPTGTAFKHIRFRFTLARGGTTTLTPDMLYAELEFRAKHKARWQHRLTVDLGRYTSGGLSARAQYAALRTAAESSTMVEFSYKDNNTDYNYYVDVISITSQEQTGQDYTGQVSLVLAES